MGVPPKSSIFIKKKKHFGVPPFQETSKYSSSWIVVPPMHLREAPAAAEVPGIWNQRGEKPTAWGKKMVAEGRHLQK